MLRVVDTLEYYLDRSKIVPYRILVVDDDLTLAEHYKLVLMAANMRVEVVHTPEHVLATLEDLPGNDSAGLTYARMQRPGIGTDHPFQ